jgi:hypothetical protein
MFTGSRKDYDINRQYQDEMREAADRARLVQAAENESEGSTFNSKKWIVIGIVVVLAFATLFAGLQRAFAQDRVNPGEGEPFHDAMLAYRVGIYFLNKGDYDRAVEKLSEAVEQMPKWAFQVEPAYAVHRWVGDEAAPWTFVKVEELQAQVDALLVENTRM